MKRTPLILTLSLLANGALAVVYWRSAPAAEPDAKLAARSEAAALRGASPEDAVAAALRAHPEFVDAMKSGDPHRMRQALIAAGFPDSYVRDVVTFHISNGVSPERLALLRAQAERPYWRANLDEKGLALQKAVRELEEKNGALAKEVFGGKVPPHPLEALQQQRRYRFLPEGKIEAVQRIDSDYAELESESRRGTGSAEERREKARLLQQEKRADLAKVLTAQELELYDLHLSPMAESLRRQLGMFEPNEAEFRALFELRRTFDEKQGRALTLGSDPAVLRQRVADQQAMNEQARAVLGEQRFAEYQRGQDYGYRAAVEIVKHFNLPAANAVETYALQQETTKRVEEIRRAAGADSAAAAPQIRAVVQEAEARITQLLGPEGADAYRKTGGAWTRTLMRNAGAPNATPRPGG